MKRAATLEQVTEQFMEELRNGRAPDAAVFPEQYPHLREELEDILPLLEELHSITRVTPPDDELYFDTLLPDDADYRVLRKINSGGMGIVFEGIQLSLNRRVAIKFLSTALLNEEKHREQFYREAQLIAQLHHPNIVKVYSANCNPPYCYYAMEYIEGSNLRELKITDKKQIARIALAVAQALAYAHCCGIVHRDIKPSNILIDADGMVRICDFGLACAVNQTTHRKITGGTFHYMAPEQILHGTADFATDQYSLGATLYECINGRPLYDGLSPQELQRQMENGNFASVCAKDDLMSIISKCLSPHPSNRYANMKNMEADLQNYLQGLPVTANPAGIVHRLILWVKRKPLAAALAVLTVVLTIATIVTGIMGYYKTAQALKYAEANAEQADSILTEVFSVIHKQPPTRLNTKLLQTLMPFYESIIRSEDVPIDKQIQAYMVLVECAHRSGDTATAEHAARQLLKLKRTSETLTLLAEILQEEEKTQEAQTLYYEVVQLYAASTSQQDKAAAVKALLALSSDPASQEYSRALSLLQQLTTESPNDPELQFCYACMLAANPQHKGQIHMNGVGDTATDVLLALTEQYPERADYAMEFIKIITRRLRNNRGFIATHKKEVDTALNRAERLLALYPSDTRVLKLVLQLHKTCIRAYHAINLNVEARKQSDRMLGIAEFLLHTPELPNESRVLIIELQMDRANLLIRGGKPESAAPLLESIRKELTYTHGEASKALHKQLSELEAQLQSSRTMRNPTSE